MQNLRGKAKVTALSMLARESARSSSIRAGLDIKTFSKNDMGVPEPSNSIYWSVTHKHDFVAGVVSKKAVGIDIECIKEISNTLFRKIVNHEEELLFKNSDRQIAFFRTFTAKEAVLKLTGEGIKGLPIARIKNVIDKKNLIVQYINKNYIVENLFFDNYVAAITKDQFNIKWELE